MIFTKNASLEEKIVEYLLSGERSALEISAYTSSLGDRVTIQAVYKSLRKLLSSGVVIKHRKLYLVSEEWVHRSQDNLRREPLFTLSEGNTISYKFSSFSQTDAYWTHLVFNIPKEDLEAPMFAYIPHNFWIHNPERFENEIEYYESFEKLKQNAFLVIGGIETDDKEVKEQLQNKYFRIHTANYSQFKRTEHIAVMGRYITTTSLEKNTAERIDTLYKDYSGTKLRSELNKIFKEKTNIKIKLEYSEKKSSRLKKVIGKDFYIPSELRKKYELL